MKKKLILIGVAVVLVAICAVSIINNARKTKISMNTVATFVHADGTTEAVDFAIDGYIIDTEYEQDELFIEFTFSDDFRYYIPTSEPSFLSFNQKYYKSPHLMIATSFAYDKQINDICDCYFALDLEKKYYIVLFGNSPDCYLVASQEGDQDYQQLITYFSKFIDSYGYGMNDWKKKTSLEMEMSCTQIAKDGTVLSTGETVTIKGWEQQKYLSDTELVLKSFVLPAFSTPAKTQTAPLILSEKSPDLYTAFGYVWDGTHYRDVYISFEKNWNTCLIRLDGNDYYYACSYYGAVPVSEILETHKWMLD